MLFLPNYLPYNLFTGVRIKIELHIVGESPIHPRFPLFLPEPPSSWNPSLVCLFLLPKNRHLPLWLCVTVTWHLAKGNERRWRWSLGAQAAENVSGICHVFVSFSRTFFHGTDLSNKKTICCVTGGMKVKVDRWVLSICCSGCSPAVQEVKHHCSLLPTLGTGGNWTKPPGPGTQSAL